MKTMEHCRELTNYMTVHREVKNPLETQPLPMPCSVAQDQQQFLVHTLSPVCRFWKSLLVQECHEWVPA
jgi:hypothetical protein